MIICCKALHLACGACACAAMAWHGWCGRLFVRCGVDRLVVGSQAFYYASAFNANIGSWNTASMKDMSSVCAPSVVAQPKCGGGSGLAQAVAAQMWAESQADVGLARGTCR